MNAQDKRAPDRYLSFAKEESTEWIIEKSRFIGYAAPTSSEEEALEFVKKVRREHPDATHVAFAYTIGPEGSLQRANDDGEPSGTAGVPILEVLKREKVLDGVICAVRYFGGIKLGAGGLVRAYGKTAKLALDAAGVVPWVRHRHLYVKTAYDLEGSLSYQLNQWEAKVIDTAYLAEVERIIDVPLSEMQEMEEKIRDLSRASAKLSWGDVHYSPDKKVP